MPQSCDPFTISMAKTIEIIFHAALILSRSQVNLLHVMLLLAFINKQCNAFHHNVCCSHLLRCKRSMSVFQLSLHVFSTDPPRLVAIESPDHIPRRSGSYPPKSPDHMTKMEEPVMLLGNDQAWRRMCLPHADHIEINIQPDLQWELKREEYVKLFISSDGHELR